MSTGPTVKFSAASEVGPCTMQAYLSSRYWLCRVVDGVYHRGCCQLRVFYDSRRKRNTDVHIRMNYERVFNLIQVVTAQLVSLSPAVVGLWLTKLTCLVKNPFRQFHFFR